MFTIGPDALHIEGETEQDNNLSTRSSEEGSSKQSHQHYHLLHTSGKVPAGFLHYLTDIVSKQGYEVVLVPEKEA